MPSAGSDDFLIPTNVDLSEKCTSLSKIEWVSIYLYHIYKKKYKLYFCGQSTVILPTGAAISLTCYSYLLWMYFVVNSPVLKRHPTSKMH